MRNLELAMIIASVKIINYYLQIPVGNNNKSQQTVITGIRNGREIDFCFL